MLQGKSYAVPYPVAVAVAMLSLACATSGIPAWQPIMLSPVLAVPVRSWMGSPFPWPWLHQPSLQADMASIAELVLLMCGLGNARRHLRDEVTGLFNWPLP